VEAQHPDQTSSLWEGDTPSHISALRCPQYNSTRFWLYATGQKCVQ